MRRPVRTLSFAALLGAASFVPSLRLANAGPATDDNDELVADPEFTGLPDKDSHSGVFLDIIAAGSSSIVQDSYYRVVTEPATASLKVLVFDGNCGGLWDQNLIQHGAGSAVLPDGSVVEYDLMTDSPDFPRTVVALGESESATPRPGAKVFSYAVDSRWEFLYDGPNHPSSTVLATGEHQYVLHVKYRLPTPSGAAVAPINGFKLAANGVLGQSPNAGETLLGGFIGGVVDSRNLLFALPGAPAAGSEYSVSRDHYPDALEPAASLNGLLLNGAAYAPAVRYPAPDAYENRYAGSFDIRVRLVPKPGESWAQFLASLILEEGDADDVDDASGVGPDGMPSPSIAGVPPDDGRFYVDTSGRQHDNSGYRLPVAAAPADAGSPWLELIDPNGVVRVTLFDLSGNVSQEDATGNAFERIPVPADGVPGLWTLRMHHLDARNSWFLRTNAETRADRQSLEGRVFCDLDGDTTDDLDTDPGIAGVVVTIQRTDVVGEPPILRTTDATGAWRVETIAAGTYAVSVTDGQAAIGAKKKTTTQPVPATVAPSQNVRDVDLGYLPSGAVGDRVWCDEDGDKAQDPGEPGLDGVTVELYRLDPQGPVLLGTRGTAGGGVYLFDNLPDATYRAVVRTDTVPGKKTPTTDTTCDATITGGGSELGCDFGFRPVGALGDRVWEDRDGDGTQGPPATEPGLNGVVVELLDATGTVVLRTTTTTGDGGYLFEGLADGDYRVRVAEASVPPGYARTTPATNPRAASVVDGSVDLTVDFGYRATGRLGDRVWCDEDGDQVQDPEEPGLVGVTVELYRVVAGVPTFLASQTTGTNGAYLFDALPDGTYRAVVLPATVPGAKEPTTETTCEEAIVAGSSALGCDFGFRPAGALGDRVWHDCDRDGVQDADEPGFDGVVVRLYLVTPQAPVLVRTTTTANDGHYLFDHLDDGAYLVEVDESALRPTMFRSWPALNPLPSAVVDGSKDLTRDFGYCFLGAIGDRVWLDRDGDGLQDLPADEPGIDGAVVRLYEVTPAGPVLVGTKTTAGGGLYLFDNLPDATYRVEVDESGLPGLARTAPAANPTTAVIAGGERRFDVDFGYRPRGAIGDRVWLDVDGDAVQDAPADEPGLDGVTVLLLRRQGDVLSIVATKTTAGGGLYRFDGLDDGEYLVTVDDTTLPKTVVRTFPATVPATATITNGSEDLTKDFGYRYTGRIGDRVWLDVDGDAVQDAPADEPGLDGVTVTLARVVSGVPVPVGTRTTVNGGAYLFDGLPDGEYRVDVVPASGPAGLVRTFPATVPATATITNGSEDLTKDFGYR
ncbi:MAG: hypothetical protein IT460_08450, partial [Planctomycetes bacterium]|nr:hypothetical protein [Planctomycetota bacterium]